MLPPLITLEEHFLSTATAGKQKEAGDKVKVGPIYFPEAYKRLPDLGPLRLQSMDENNVSRQVISNLPILIDPQQCRETNDQLAAAVRANPDRFSGFAALPVAQPEAIADEFRRCVRELGFVGALVGNHADGRFYDGPAYDGLWGAAQELGVPVYLHPTGPSEGMRDVLYRGSYGEAESLAIGTFAYGWHAEVATHVLRLFAGGVFDRFPRLKMVVGHFGSGLPAFLDRVRWVEGLGGFQGNERSFRQVYDENIWITTSGCWSVDPMATILRNTKIERVLYSVDYPFTPNEEGVEFMIALQKSGLVTEEQFEMIAYKNAQKLLGVK